MILTAVWVGAWFVSVLERFVSPNGRFSSRTSGQEALIPRLPVISANLTPLRTPPYDVVAYREVDPFEHRNRRNTGTIAAILLVDALCLIWTALQLLAVSSWGTAAASALCALACLLGAFHLPPSLSRWPASRVEGILLLASGVSLALGAAWYLLEVPFVSWVLLLYPAACALVWCGETRLRNHEPVERLNALWQVACRHGGELLGLALITSAGLLLRLWMIRLAPLAHGLFGDEVVMINHAWNLVHSPGPWPLYQMEGGSISMFQPAGLAMGLLGSGLSAARLPYLLMGTSLTPAFYLLARQFARAPAVLCAAGLLTFGFWPAMASVLMFGWDYGLVFQLIGLALLVRGIRCDGYTTCAIGGGILALCLYSYLGHRLLPLTAGPVLLAYFIGGHSALRHRISLVLSFAAGFCIIAVPWIGIVANNSTLWLGDIQSNSIQTQATLHQGIWAVLSLVLDHIRTMLLGFFIEPGTDTPELVIAHSGVFDTLTTMLIVLSVLYALTRFWRVENMLIFATLLLVLLEASATSTDALWIYRLNSMVPMLFLAIALLLDRCLSLLRDVARRTRWAALMVLLILGWSGTANARMVAAQLSDCTLLQSDSLSVGNSEPLLQAEAANAADPRHAIFVVSAHNFWPLFQWQWAYQAQPPVYSPIPGQNPSRWPLQFSAWPNNTPPALASTFWPPHPAPGRTGVTYIIDEGASSSFLPLLQHAYPNGHASILQPSSCPSYRVTIYTLTSQQIATGRSG